ncbi:MAG: hypothetical protein ACXWUG_22730 [Polyangiales bacterium]
MSHNTILRAAALAACVTVLVGCWAVPGNTGWRCESNADCNEGLSCLTYSPPKGSQLVHLCAKPGDRMTTKTPYNWAVIVGFWAVILGLPGFLTFSILRDRRDARKRAQ